METSNIDLHNKNIINKRKTLSKYECNLLNDSIIKKTETELFDIYSSDVGSDSNSKDENAIIHLY